MTLPRTKPGKEFIPRPPRPKNELSFCTTVGRFECPTYALLLQLSSWYPCSHSLYDKKPCCSALCSHLPFPSSVLYHFHPGLSQPVFPSASIVRMDSLCLCLWRCCPSAGWKPSNWARPFSPPLHVLVDALRPFCLSIKSAELCLLPAWTICRLGSSVSYATRSLPVVAVLLDADSSKLWWYSC